MTYAEAERMAREKLDLAPSMIGVVAHLLLDAYTWGCNDARAEQRRLLFRGMPRHLLPGEASDG